MFLEAPVKFLKLIYFNKQHNEKLNTLEILSLTDEIRNIVMPIRLLHNKCVS